MIEVICRRWAIFSASAELFFTEAKFWDSVPMVSFFEGDKVVGFESFIVLLWLGDKEDVLSLGWDKALILVWPPILEKLLIQIMMIKR